MSQTRLSREKKLPAATCWFCPIYGQSKKFDPQLKWSGSHWIKKRKLKNLGKRKPQQADWWCRPAVPGETHPPLYVTSQSGWLAAGGGKNAGEADSCWLAGRLWIWSVHYMRGATWYFKIEANKSQYQKLTTHKRMSREHEQRLKWNRKLRVILNCCALQTSWWCCFVLVFF